MSRHGLWVDLRSTGRIQRGQPHEHTPAVGAVGAAQPCDGAAASHASSAVQRTHVHQAGPLPHSGRARSILEKVYTRMGRMQRWHRADDGTGLRLGACVAR